MFVRPLLLAALAAAPPVHAELQQVEALALASPGIVAARVSGNGASTIPVPFFPSSNLAITRADGNLVVFSSLATNLQAGVTDDNGGSDVWLHDRAADTTTLVSHVPGAAATTGNGASRALGMSKDGRRVLFASRATDLVPGQVDTNQAEDLFLYEVASGNVTLLSRRRGAPAITANGVTGTAVISADGETVVFVTAATDILSLQDFNNSIDHYVHDVASGVTEPLVVSNANAGRLPNAGSFSLDLSADGRTALFASLATDIVPGQLAGNGTAQLFLARRGQPPRLVSHVAGNPLQPSTSTTNGGSLSADGKWVAFESLASNLVAGVTDTGNVDLFLHDVEAASNSLLSFSASDPLRAANNSVSGGALLNADGSRIAYASSATNLIAGLVDGNSNNDLFVQERVGGQRTLVSHRSDDSNRTASHGSAQVMGFDAAGKHLVYESFANNLVPGQADTASPGPDVFFYALGDNASTLLTAPVAAPTQAGGDNSAEASVSDDGRVALLQARSNLVAGDDNFVFDLHAFEAGTADLVSRAAPQAAGRPTGNGSTLPREATMDAAGRYSIFFSSAPDLVAPAVDAGGQLYLRDRLDGAVRRVTHVAGDPSAPWVGSSGVAGATAISGDGDWVAFTARGDSTLVPGYVAVFALQVWLWHRPSGETRLVSHVPGAPLSPGNRESGTTVRLSFDGRYIAYLSRAGNLVPGQTGAVQENLYVYDRLTQSTHLVSHGAASPSAAIGAGSVFEMSRDGERFAFTSNDAAVVAGIVDTNAASDVFLHDRVSDTTVLVSRAFGAAQAGSAASTDPVLSDDGTVLAFRSAAVDLVAGAPQATAFADVYRWRSDGSVQLLSHADGNPAQPANGESAAPQLGAGGERVMYASAATDLVAGYSAAFAGNSVYAHVDGANRLVNRVPGSATAAGNDAVLRFRYARGGRYALLQTRASNLVAGALDAQGVGDEILVDLDEPARTFLASHRRGAPLQACGAGSGGEPPQGGISDDGQVAVFGSGCADLVADDANGATDGFEFLLDEPVSLALLDIAPATTQAGQAYLVRVAATALRGVPIGTLRVDDGGQACTVALDAAAAGVGECTLATAQAGVAPLGVSFESDAGFADASLSAAHVVAPASTLATLVATPAPAAAGVPATLVAHLAVVAPGGGTPAGSVDFFDGAALLCDDVAVAPDARATCVHAFPQVGVHALRAVYAGSVDHAGSEASLSLDVLPSADLALQLALLTPVATTGAALQFEARVDNAGPSTATAVRVDIVVPAGIGVDSVAGEGWTCSQAAPIACTAGTLPPGPAPRVRVQLRAPAADGEVAVSAGVSASSADANAADNADAIAATVDGPPVIEAITPVQGSTEGGYPMQITGRNFGAAAGSASLGAQPCAVSFWSDTQLVCNVPAGAGILAVTVVQAATADDRATQPDFFAYHAPRVATLSPAVGDPAGDYEMQIDGFDFGAAGAQVTIGGAACTGVQHDAAQPHRRLRCTVPAGTGTALPVLVLQAGQASDGAARFSYASVAADLQMAKASARIEVFARRTDEWTLLVTNLGPDPVLAARVVDDLPGHLLAVAWTCTGLAGGSCEQAQGLGDIDQRVDLPVGSSALFLVSARLPRAPLIDVVNRARVESPAGSADPVPGNNADEETDPMSTIFIDEFESP